MLGAGESHFMGNLRTKEHGIDALFPAPTQVLLLLNLPPGGRAKPPGEFYHHIGL